ncbi:MAG: hypothetical protein GC152_05500 [Alphaproteobacteria bacterium]|nr:hypothetical protein [Alphaproteobacteria bacterium]
MSGSPEPVEVLARPDRRPTFIGARLSPPRHARSTPSIFLKGEVANDLAPAPSRELTVAPQRRPTGAPAPRRLEPARLEGWREASDFSPLEPADLLNQRRAGPEDTVRAPRFSAWDLRLATAKYFLFWRHRELWNYSFNFGESGARYLQRIFGRRRLAKLDELRHGERAFVVVRGLPTASFFFPYPKRHRDLHGGVTPRRFRHFDMVVAGLLFLAGAEVRRRYQNAAAPIVRTLLSAPTEPQVGDRDGSDMHLRFHQSTVEKAMPDPNLPAAGEDTCTVKAYAAVRNRRQIPIYVLPVKTVLERLPGEEFEWVMEQLERPVFQKLGPHFDNNDTAVMAEGQPILRRGVARGDWLMSYDPDRVWTEDENAKRALRKLRGAIMAARKDAIEIILDRRDVLIVDNLRALVARREYYPFRATDALRAAFFTKPRWLRLYYGFPLPHRDRR